MESRNLSIPDERNYTGIFSHKRIYYLYFSLYFQNCKRTSSSQDSTRIHDRNDPKCFGFLYLFFGHKRGQRSCGYKNGPYILDCPGFFYNCRNLYGWLPGFIFGTSKQRYVNGLYLICFDLCLLFNSLFDVEVSYFENHRMAFDRIFHFYRFLDRHLKTYAVPSSGREFGDRGDLYHWYDCIGIRHDFLCIEQKID